MTAVQEFEDKVEQLLAKRRLNVDTEAVCLTAFCKHFTAFTWLAHSHEGDGVEMLDILLDDSKLVNGYVFNKNFIANVADLYPTELRRNKTWQRAMSDIIGFNGKGVGNGELYLALVIADWKFQRVKGKGDGYVAGGARELKNNGASLKPIAENYRIQDFLNREIFEGHRAGPVKQFPSFHTWLHEQPQPELTLVSYFTQLYPGRDVTDMCSALAKVTTGREWSDTIGKYVLSWYQQTDNWTSLVVLDQDKMVIANIHDVSDLSLFPNIRFDWKSSRGKDTQAIADGYVNIRI